MNPRPPLPPFTEDSAKQSVQLAEDGYMARRYASINDQRITEAERKFRWQRTF